MDAKVSTKTKTFQNLNKNCPLVALIVINKVTLHKAINSQHKSNA